MQFTATADKLIPDLAPREELVLLARTLWREGYNDHLAGHITISLGDGTLLCNPWLLTWDEIRPCDVIRIDLEGNLVEGDWPVPLGIPLHLELHRARDDVRVAMHNHPHYGTVWSDMRELPPALDQSSCLGGGELVLVDEYGGSVDSSEAPLKPLPPWGMRILRCLPGMAYSCSAQRSGLSTSAQSHSNSAAATRGVCVPPVAYLTPRCPHGSASSSVNPTATASADSGKPWSALSCALTRRCSTP